jgi:chaperonin GroES
MSFSLQSDRVAVIAEPLETKTESGLHVPDTAQDFHTPRYGEVAVVGIGHRSEATGELVPLDVAVGDQVFFHKQSGEVWKFEGTEYVVLSPREIIGKSDVTLSVVE